MHRQLRWERIGIDDNGTNSGSAFVFKKDSSTVGGWTETTKFWAFDGSSGGRFGESIDVSEYLLVVGASDPDAAYVYEIFYTGSTFPLTTAAPEKASTTSSSTIIYVAAFAVVGIAIIVLVGLILHYMKWKWKQQHPSSSDHSPAQLSARNDQVVENVSAGNTALAEPISLPPATIKASAILVDDTLEDIIPGRIGHLNETGPFYKDQMRSVIPEHQLNVSAAIKKVGPKIMNRSSRGKEQLKMDPPP
jgi:hypothetical protein